MFYYWGMDSCSDNSVFFGRLKKGCLKDYRRLEKLKSNAMKFYQMLIVAAIFSTACSSPKYVYHFDTYDYKVGKPTEEPLPAFADEHSPLSIKNEVLVVSAEPQPVLTSNSQKVEANQTARSVSEKVHAMSKTERKEFKKELKKELKSLVKRDVKKGDNVDSVNRTKVFDTLVALSIVFGVAGIVLITLANISNAFWIIGAISLAVGAVLFVKWVANGNG
jgi:hypothetical protein